MFVTGTYSCPKCTSRYVYNIGRLLTYSSHNKLKIIISSELKSN